MAATNYYFGNYASSPFTDSTLNTAMASLASGAYASSAIITPSSVSATPEEVMLELVFGAAVTWGGSDTGIRILLVPAPQNVAPSYPNGASGPVPAAYQIANIPLVVSSSWVRGSIPFPILLPPYPFKLAVYNSTSVAFDSSATLNVWSFNRQGA